jgi:hypothetical protein
MDLDDSMEQACPIAFLDLLLGSTSSFIFFTPKDLKLKKKCDPYLVWCFTASDTRYWFQNPTVKCKLSR